MLRQPLVRLALAAALVAVTMQVASGWFGIVTTHGQSMEPVFHQGDVVLTMRQSSYGVGDIVGYRSQELRDEVVLHRIVRLEDGTYVTKGDHNDWLDRDRPTASDVVGRAWFKLPGAGRYLTSVGRFGPLATGGLSTALFLVGLTRKRRHHEAEGRTKRAPRMTEQLRRATGWTSPSRLALAAASLAVVAAVGFLRPAEDRVTTTLTYEHAARFDYGTAVPQSVVYEDGTVDVGDPVFRSAVHALTVGLDYDLDASDVEGTVALDVVVRIGAWEHVVSRGRPVPLEDGGAHPTARIELAAIDEVAQDFAAVAGQKPAAATAVVVATVDARGRVDATPFASTFRPELELPVTATEVTVDPEKLEQSETGTVETDEARPATVTAMGQDIPIPLLRVAGLLGAAGLALAAAVQALAIGRRRGARLLEPEPHDPRILQVASFEPSTRVVEVTDLATLLRLAEDLDRYVLCATDAIGRRTYAVDDSGTTYRTATTWVP